MVQEGEAAFGILLCGSANGVCMTANKHAGIRAGLSFNPEVARLIRLHNDANIIGIPARFVSLSEAKEMIDIFINTPFEGGRHQQRVDKIRK
jgi:ribose 5-phosphate isomerase B